MKNPFKQVDTGTYSEVPRSMGMLDDFATRKNIDTISITSNIKYNTVVEIANSTSITPNLNLANMFFQTNTGGAGTLTLNNPTGTTKNGMALILRLKCSSAQTYSYGSTFRGGTLALPTTSTGSSKTDYLCFIYNSQDNKWDLVGYSAGY